MSVAVCIYTVVLMICEFCILKFANKDIFKAHNRFSMCIRSPVLAFPTLLKKIFEILPYDHMMVSGVSFALKN